ncbi:MAG: hypothetical protein ACR2QM_18170 [Longimicrobiales bacterium]
MTSRFSKVFPIIPALLLAAACGQDVAAPELDQSGAEVSVPAPSFELTTTSGMTALRWEVPLEKDRTEAEGFSSEGGSMGVAPGIELLVPAGAVEDKTELRITSRAGEDVSFDLLPHGLEFNRSVTVRIHLEELANRDEVTAAAKAVFYSGTAVDRSRIPLGSVTAIYFAMQNGELVKVLQTFPVFFVGGKYLEFETDHFSGYALAA